MIDATPAQIQQYCLDIVCMFILVEEQRKRQRIPVWANAEEVAMRVAVGLQCTEQAAQSYLIQLMQTDRVEVYKNGGWLRPARRINTNVK